MAAHCVVGFGGLGGFRDVTFTSVPRKEVSISVSLHPLSSRIGADLQVGSCLRLDVGVVTGGIPRGRRTSA